ncbi:MAG: uracil-DNA glycosylase [Deltaproteobacteria bacterium]|nr:MAG: uracil-DNA glycosylase [Deltaproteobacteria bacterium]
MCPQASHDTLGAIAAEVIACRKCPRLVAHCEHIARVKRRAFRNEEYWGRPVPGFGDTQAGLILVGLAPAAHGANRTGRMFTGDRSGQWLYRALHRAGWANTPQSNHRSDGLRLRGAYVTAAARCAPPANKPTREELGRCRPFLERELAYFLGRARRRPIVVLALGRIAHDACLDALRNIGIGVPRPKPRFGHGAMTALDTNVTLLCSYHPSQQNTQTGRLTEPMFDSVFHAARRLLEP